MKKITKQKILKNCPLLKFASVISPQNSHAQERSEVVPRIFFFFTEKHYDASVAYTRRQHLVHSVRNGSGEVC